MRVSCSLGNLQTLIEYFFTILTENKQLRVSSRNFQVLTKEKTGGKDHYLENYCKLTLIINTRVSQLNKYFYSRNQHIYTFYFSQHKKLFNSDKLTIKTLRFTR